ncbi:MAG: lipocalin family protein [Bacteroidales bacterium]|nr:lipocalin family protein [Bacteroidales bacterium]MBN2758220.1 lipocalin family protein [Bacteroidales bacterium]
MIVAILAITLTIVSFSSCNKDEDKLTKKDMLTTTWNITSWYSDTFTLIPYPDFNLIIELKFENDGDFTFALIIPGNPDPVIINGTWAFNDDETELTLDFVLDLKSSLNLPLINKFKSTDAEYTYDIIKLTENELHIESAVEVIKAEKK